MHRNRFLKGLLNDTVEKALVFFRLLWESFRRKVFVFVQGLSADFLLSLFFFKKKIPKWSSFLHCSRAQKLFWQSFWLDLLTEKDRARKTEIRKISTRGFLPLSRKFYFENSGCLPFKVKQMRDPFSSNPSYGFTTRLD